MPEKHLDTLQVESFLLQFCPGSTPIRYNLTRLWATTTIKVNGKGQNFIPPPPLNPLTDRHQIVHRQLCGNVYHRAKFYPDRIRGFVSAHARLRAATCLLCYVWVLKITYRLQPRRSHGFRRKYTKRRGSAQACAFLGSQTQNDRSAIRQIWVRDFKYLEKTYPYAQVTW